MPDLPDQPDGYLFLVVDKEFYAMTKPQMLSVATKIPRGNGSDEADVLEALLGLGFVLADIQGPGESSDGRPDSCACVALNIDAFDDRIKDKQRKIEAIRKAAPKVVQAARRQAGASAKGKGDTKKKAPSKKVGTGKKAGSKKRAQKA